MKLIFIRHGDPDYEKDSLTEKGWREAEILAKRVATWDIKQIYCSPMGRAKDTCSVSLKETGREAITCDWLKEFYYRIWDEQEGEWTIAWDFYPRDFNDRDDLHDKNLWAETEIMKTGDIAAHAKEVYEGFDALLEKCNVVGTPGSGFGKMGEGYLRLTGFGNRERTIEAVERIKAKFHQ